MRARGCHKAALAAGLLSLLLAGCSTYSDFTLPPAGSNAPAGALRWEPIPAPVMGRGDAGSWEAVDVLNPSVVRKGNLYYNLYSGFDGRSWHTGTATSSDGMSWTRLGRVLSPGPSAWEGDYIAANGSVLFSGEEFKYWYQAGAPPAIGLARSGDALRWTKSAEPVLRPGPRGSWDERGVADPYVVEAAGRYYLYYLGQDRARRQRLGVAESADGVHWRKLVANPILELGAAGRFDENGLGEPAVWNWRGSYWMLYTGRDRREIRRIGAAWSGDGVHWNRLPAGSVLAGGQAWNSKVVCDPTVLVDGDDVRVWFGGGDVAAPAERLNGQIGYATLRLDDANLTK